MQSGGKKEGSRHVLAHPFGRLSSKVSSRTVWVKLVDDLLEPSFPPLGHNLPSMMLRVSVSMASLCVSLRYTWM